MQVGLADQERDALLVASAEGKGQRTVELGEKPRGTRQQAVPLVRAAPGNP